MSIFILFHSLKDTHKIHRTDNHTTNILIDIKNKKTRDQILSRMVYIQTYRITDSYIHIQKKHIYRQTYKN